MVENPLLNERDDLNGKSDISNRNMGGTHIEYHFKPSKSLCLQVDLLLKLGYLSVVDAHDGFLYGESGTCETWICLGEPALR